MITARRPNHQITRNVQHFKFLSKRLPVTIQNRTEPDQAFSFPEEADENRENVPPQNLNDNPENNVGRYPNRIHVRPSTSTNSINHKLVNM